MTGVVYLNEEYLYRRILDARARGYSKTSSERWNRFCAAFDTPQKDRFGCVVNTVRAIYHIGIHASLELDEEVMRETAIVIRGLSEKYGLKWRLHMQSEEVN